MLTKRLFPFYLAFLLITVFSGCSKDDEAAESKMDIIANGQWKITGFTFSPPEDLDQDGDLDSDFFALAPPCYKDNYVVFKRDGNLEVNEGPTKCSATSPQSVTGTWAFVNDEKELLFDGDRGTITEFTSNRFRVQFTDQTDSWEITFSK